MFYFTDSVLCFGSGEASVSREDNSGMTMTSLYVRYTNKVPMYDCKHKKLKNRVARCSNLLAFTNNSGQIYLCLVCYQ